MSDYSNIYDLTYENLFYSSHRPILFFYLYMKQSDLIISKNLGINFKKSYKLSYDSVQKTEKFENSTWYYSNNSVVNLSLSTNDSITNSFFEDLFISKLKTIYFFLFLNACHQKIYLLDTIYKIKNKNILINSYSEIKRIQDDVDITRSRIMESNFLYFFASPSSIDHINLFYDTIVDVFEIDQLKISLNENLELINLLYKENLKLLDEYKEAREVRRKGIQEIFLSLVGTFVSFAALYDAFNKIISNQGIVVSPKGHIWVLILIGIFSSILFLFPLIFGIKKIIKFNKIEKDLKQKIEKRIKKHVCIDE